MIVNGLELVYTDNFLDELAGIHQYVATFSTTRARQLSSRVMNFTTDQIPLNPYAFAECGYLKTPEGIYRRAIYRKTYALIFKIESETLVFLDIYHTSRNKGV